MPNQTVSLKHKGELYARLKTRQLSRRNEVNINVMIIYPYENGNSRTSSDAQNVSYDELRRKWQFYQRFFNVKANPAGAEMAGPIMQLLLNHFYDTEIAKTYRFNRIELADSIVKNFFDDVKFNHMR